jgi:hypothetical protein
VDAGLLVSRRSHANTRLRSDARGRYSGIRQETWRTEITGIEIANGVPKSGTRLDPIITGILVSSLPHDGALTLRSFFELDLLKK